VSRREVHDGGGALRGFHGADAATNGRGAGAPASAPSGRIPPGTVLNHIYEVGRLIGRGGMGEVYEGVNVNTDERVAIKVILEHLAEDPKVQALFRAEASVLTRLSHDALVQYRVMAREPTLGVSYIVTDFVDGERLEKLIGRLDVSQRALKALLRRLAEGLAAAHARHVFHRDISPDNVLLPEGRLEAAKIIDFGIAKDVQTHAATLVGGGFAGKLNFVAPEQLGDFGGQTGPWTDIYSLGLVMLAVASHRIVDMGATFVEAVDRRRSGPDLGPLPQSLRPIFARMLAPDPSERFQSMRELIAELDAIPDEPTFVPDSEGSASAKAITPAPAPRSASTQLAPALPSRPPAPRQAPARVVPPRRAAARPKNGAASWWIGGGVVAAAALAIGAILLFSHQDRAAPREAPPARVIVAAPAPAAPPPTPVAATPTPIATAAPPTAVPAARPAFSLPPADSSPPQGALPAPSPPPVVRRHAHAHPAPAKKGHVTHSQPGRTVSSDDLEAL
jgi:serine/threonine protein kinase